MTTTAPVHAGYERGTAAYGRLGAAMWCAGLATFVLVYCVQALLPTLAVEFGVSSSAASLALSATTGTLALAIVPLSAVAESWGRARVMTVALAASAVLGVLAPLAPTFGALVAVRALQGVALAALPALAMAHVTREVAPRWLGGAATGSRSCSWARSSPSTTPWATACSRRLSRCPPRSWGWSSSATSPAHG